MTYAYALVLEDGTHNSNEQPLFKATLSTSNSIITCASPQYYLPTFNNATPRGGGGGGGTGATLDTATALRNGFTNSPVYFFSNAAPGGLLRDVWTKAWTEVTFDLSPYRGQSVTLTFEADNCIPGGHFGYAYVALRNDCAGLAISGPPVACSNTVNTYSIPALAGAAYTWQVPPGWQIVSRTDTNFIRVIPNNIGGDIIVHEVNSCADLRDTITVSTSPPTIAGAVNSNNTVCEGINTTPLTLNGYTGNILNWIASTNNGISWSAIPGTTGATSYTAQNLNAATVYRAVVQNGSSCSIDTSARAIILVDPKSVGGIMTPANMNFCLGQYKDATLTLNSERGVIQYWQSSQDGISWTNFTPVVDTSYDIPPGTTQSAQYRAIVQNGVCPIDSSSVANVNVIPMAYPKQTISPKDTIICYDDTARLNSYVTIGTNYTWTNFNTLTSPASGTIPSTPFLLTNEAHPLTTTRYILGLTNAGCPNVLKDTFRVQVLPRVLVNAGRDTAIVYNQPLQLQVTSNYTSNVSYNWTPVTGLNNPAISNPVAMLGITIDSVRYTVMVTDNIAGCFGTDDLLVRVFKTLPDIFVPNSFTPGKGSNNVFRPVPVGIASLDYFRVYNRWGQLVFSTSTTGQGWDGSINGKPQNAGSYVWMVQGKDYTGKTIFHKGSMVLIR
jgi:gliding motility-associated-like protein